VRDTYTLREDDQVVALAYVTERFIGDDALLNRIFVPRSCRRRGYGRRILEEVCADADREGVDLWLTVEPDDLAEGDDGGWLWRLYRSAGFEPGEDCMHRSHRRSGGETS